jgi:transposase InsO family protein
LLTDKKAVLTSIALENSLQQANNTDVFGIWTDNGSEFKDEFADLLQRKYIKPVKSLPSNPEQNGKIERFWKNIGDRKYEVQIGSAIEHYNIEPHTGLPVVERSFGRMGYLTPYEAYNLGPHWRRDHTPT